MPNSWAMGPLTMTAGAAPPVVAWTLARLNPGCRAALTAATTTGKCGGWQPAITALMATFSRVTCALRGCTTPRAVAGDWP